MTDHQLVRLPAGSGTMPAHLWTCHCDEIGGDIQVAESDVAVLRDYREHAGES